jgi:hypothetical protein
MVCSQNRHFPITDLRLAVSSTAGILSKQIEPWCPMWYSWVVQQSTRSIGAPGISMAKPYVTPARPDTHWGRPTPADAAALRGVPVLGPGIGGGAIKGTVPGANLR